MKSPKPRVDVFIAAAEPSGDQLGAALAQSLTAKAAHLTIRAIGGERLEAAGFASAMNIEGLAVLGFVEGLKAYPFVLSKVSEATRIIMAENPRCVVLIDSWGFMVRVAKRLKAKGYTGTIIKFVAPQVWAMRSGRAKILARYVDHLLSIWPMDKSYFDAAGLPQTFVGHPIFDTDYEGDDGTHLRARLGIAPDERVIGLFAGSRPSEIKNIAPAIIEADTHLRTLTGGHQTICVVADPIAEQMKPLLAGRPIHALPQSDLLGALGAIDGAVACSGTITTQLAAAGVPAVVVYRVSPLTFAVAKRLLKPGFITMVNIAADQPFMPEFYQEQIEGPQPAQALWDIISDPKARAARSSALKQQTRLMGAGQYGASDRAADAVLTLISGEAP